MRQSAMDSSRISQRQQEEVKKLQEVKRLPPRHNQASVSVPNLPPLKLDKVDAPMAHLQDTPVFQDKLMDNLEHALNFNISQMAITQRDVSRCDISEISS